MGALHPGEMTRFDFRIESTRKEIIERAASLLGMTASQFAKVTLLERAEEITRKFSSTVLSDNDRDIFLASLEADLKPSAATLKAVERFKQKRDAQRGAAKPESGR